MLRLPLDRSTFSVLRKNNYLYVDKTKYAYDLITHGHRFFLSRPRRFGKSLFVSTLKEILSGNKDLFEGLWIAQSDYSWQQHGVIVLDFSTLGIRNLETFNKGIYQALTEITNSYKIDVKIDSKSSEIALRAVVMALYQHFGHVAILVDEYDSPILRSLADAPRALEIRNSINSFFATIKGLDAYVDFVFITGVSSFAKAGIFSGMNNLQIITLSERFAAICGYTDEEIDHYFPEYIKAWAEKISVPYEQIRQNIKEWYNGYRFSESVITVYNPFSVMHALNEQAFYNFWFQSGTPTFLINELKKEYQKQGETIFFLNNMKITRDSLGTFDVGATPFHALMFQTGYLTIAEYDKTDQLYTLDYPNFEVKTALQKNFLEIFAHLSFGAAEQKSLQLKSALDREDLEEVVSLLKKLFTHIPYQLHIKEEKFYHALLQIALGAAGIQVQSEYSISHGRIDMVLNLSNLIYIIEIKFNESAQIALDQIEERRYYEPFLNRDKPILLVGLSFKREPKKFDITYAVKKLK